MSYRRASVVPNDRPSPLRRAIAFRRRFDSETGAARRFREAFAILGLQRNLKIAGIFVRLALRDNKPQYLAHLPRILDYVQTNLAHEAAAPVRGWLETHAPDWAAWMNDLQEPA